MNKILITILFFITLTGCATTEKIETKEVKTPIFQEVPEPPKLEQPELPIYDLNEDSTSKEIAEAYVITIKILQKELEYRTFLLNSYNQNNQNNK